MIEETPQNRPVLLSARMKEQQVTIRGNRAYRESLTQYNSIAVLANIKLDRPIKYKWSLRVIKHTGVILLGICQGAAAHLRQFRFPHQNNGHGHYTVTCEGTAYSIEKIIYDAFRICNGEVVDIVFDKRSMKLFFKNQKNGNTYEMAVDPAPEGDSYYPCIFVGLIGDEVELISFSLEEV